MIAARSPGEWLARGVLALALVAVGYAGARQSLALSVFKDDPEHAQRLAPSDARVAAALSRRLLLTESGPLSRRRAGEMARAALERDPTAVQAVATLGILAGVQGNVALARRWFAYADSLSRREPMARLWLIEDAVRRGNAKDALHHYDVALRTDDGAADVLFPVLTDAASDRNVAAELVGTLSHRPSWANAFTVYAAGHGRDPEAIAGLFGDLQAANIPIAEPARPIMIDRLIASRRFDAAWAQYAAGHPGVDRRQSRPLGAGAEATYRSQLDWVATGAENGLSVSLPRRLSANYLDYFVPPAVSGQLVAQVQLLPSGSYRLEGRGHTGGQPGQPRPYWVLRCMPGGRELLRVDVPPPATGTARFGGNVVVPSDCPTQMLALVARAPNDPAGIAGRIEHLLLRPIVAQAIPAD